MNSSPSSILWNLPNIDGDVAPLTSKQPGAGAVESSTFVIPVYDESNLCLILSVSPFSCIANNVFASASAAQAVEDLQRALAEHLRSCFGA